MEYIRVLNYTNDIPHFIAVDIIRLFSMQLVNGLVSGFC